MFHFVSQLICLFAPFLSSVGVRNKENGRSLSDLEAPSTMLRAEPTKYRTVPRFQKPARSGRVVKIEKVLFKSAPSPLSDCLQFQSGMYREHHDFQVT
jgi:hypothetical protein